MPKNIVVLSDGTGQEGGKGHDTNVYKLFRMLEDRTDRQVVFYDEGLGTDWRKITGSAFGVGFSKNLLQCYQFIFDNYESEDRIFLFGFSRGAATVRSLSSFIQYFGILPKSRPELIHKAYKLYEKGRQAYGANIWKQTRSKFVKDDDSDVLNDEAEEFIKEHPNQWANIEFMGVWDTVPALGFVAMAGVNLLLGKALRYSFHDFRLHPRVQNAYHALSIDDDRLWFHPSLWREKSREDQVVEQVWFSGAHTDIGGGFNNAGLSDISLEWMVEKAVHHGLRLYLRSRKYWNFVIAPDMTDEWHPPREGAAKIFKEGPRDKVWSQQRADKKTEETAENAFGAPIIHQSVLERHMRRKNRKKEWILEDTSKSTGAGFDEFLRRKFYDYIKFEWKKYDWVNDVPQEKDFEEWIKGSIYAEYKDQYDWDKYREHLEKGYKAYCKRQWQVDGTDLAISRNKWLGWNKFENKKNRVENWIDGYQPYKDWREKHTMKFEDVTYYVEPISFVNAVLPSPERADVYWLSFRDYDENTLDGVLARIRNDVNSKIEKSTEYLNLPGKSEKIEDDDTPKTILDKIEKGKIRIPIESDDYKFLKRSFRAGGDFNRIDEDLKRWSGKNKNYIKQFKLKDE